MICRLGQISHLSDLLYPLSSTHSPLKVSTSDTEVASTHTVQTAANAEKLFHPNELDLG